MAGKNNSAHFGSTAKLLPAARVLTLPVRQANLAGWLVVVASAAAAVGWLSSSPPLPASSLQQAGSEDPERAHAAASRLATLSTRETLAAPRADLFAPPPSAPPRPVSAAPAMVPAAQSKPVPPPMPYRLAGRIVLGGTAKTVLARGDAVLEVREGDTLDGGYRVESIRAGHVTLLYVPLGVRETLAAASASAIESPAATTAADSRPAQLRWEGPAQVRAGDAFDVALKLTSGRVVRAFPMQLSYDAKVLEAVSVRAGSFFSAGGDLTSRISPNGSILVGASGTVATASDAEFIILTFRPIRAGATAQLTISSVLPRDADGRAIALHRPEAFRAPIID